MGGCHTHTEKVVLGLEPGRRWGLEKQPRAKWCKLKEAEKAMGGETAFESCERGDLEVSLSLSVCPGVSKALGSIPGMARRGKAEQRGGGGGRGREGQEGGKGEGGRGREIYFVLFVAKKRQS